MNVITKDTRHTAGVSRHVQVSINKGWSEPTQVTHTLKTALGQPRIFRCLALSCLEQWTIMNSALPVV